MELDGVKLVRVFNFGWLWVRLWWFFEFLRMGFVWVFKWCLLLLLVFWLVIELWFFFFGIWLNGRFVGFIYFVRLFFFLNVMMIVVSMGRCFLSMLFWFFGIGISLKMENLIVWFCYWGCNWFVSSLRICLERL